jgi:hypothetical protein
MFYRFWLLLLMSLFISSCSHVEEKKMFPVAPIAHPSHNPKSLTLSISNQQLLKKEMLAIEQGMKELLSSIATGDWHKTVEIGKQIQASYIMKQNLTPQQLQHLHKHLPEQFVKLDHSFHNYAGMLAHAAEAKNKEVVNFYFYKMTDSCVQCHSVYANDKFSGFSTTTDAQKNHHH